MKFIEQPFNYSRHFGNRDFGKVFIMGIDILGVDIMGVDILGINILARPHFAIGNSAMMGCTYNFI